MYFCMKNISALLFVTFLSLSAFGCGGSGSSSSTPTTTVSGSVFAGPAAGSIVTAKTASGTVLAVSAPSAADGSYSIAIPSSALAGDLILEASGGTFPDEATTAAGVSLGTLSAHVAAGTLTGAGTGTITIDPSSTIIQKLVAGGRTPAAAESAFAAAFGYTPDCSITPAFANASSASSTAQRLAGLRAAAFSQLTKDLGIPAARQHELILALAEDLSDGALDGRKSGGSAVSTASGVVIPADINNRFAKALVSFQSGSLNKCKLTSDKIGTLPFAKTALTASYKVEYLPGMIAATQGKTSFRIKLTNLSDGLPATGKSISLMPKMHMAGMSHATPLETVTGSATPGTYDCTVYYLMASGAGMGYWELKVEIDNSGAETATFYPGVAMSMGATSRVTLKGVSDVIGSMMGMGTSARTYYLFNDGSSLGVSSNLKLFVAAQDDGMMMNYPAVSVGSTLHDAMAAAWSVSAMAVEASTDKGATWNSLTDNGSGHWSVAGLTGLAGGGTVKVRVTVNGEQKTTDGLALTGSNGAATFTFVAAM